MAKYEFAGTTSESFRSDIATSILNQNEKKWAASGRMRKTIAMYKFAKTYLFVWSGIRASPLNFKYIPMFNAQMPITTDMKHVMAGMIKPGRFSNCNTKNRLDVSRAAAVAIHLSHRDAPCGFILHGTKHIWQVRGRSKQCLWPFIYGWRGEGYLKSKSVPTATSGM